MTTKNEIWDQIKRNLRSRISKSEFILWVSQASLLELTSGLAVVQVPNKFVALWLSENCGGRILELLHQLTGTQPALRFSYETESNRIREKKKSRPFKNTKSRFSSGLDASRTFSHFVRAGSNGLACSSAIDVANNPSYKYNPLYIYSKWSLGKTHLLHAIGNEAMRLAPEKKAVYLSTQKILGWFENNYDHKNAGFWGNERPPRFLLLDDFQTVASHKTSQKRLLSLCAQFLESNRQLVVAASAPPSQIKNLLPQLRSRLEWGLITEIRIPDQKTKMKVVQQKASQQGIQFQEDASFFLASTTNDLKDLVKKIEKIGIHAALYQNRMDITAVQTILENRLPSQMGPQRIQEITARYFQISPLDLQSQKKERRISYPRQMAIFLTRKYTGLSLKEIGKVFGNKHHSSIIYSINTIERNLKSNRDVIEDVNRLKSFLFNGTTL